MHQRLEVAVATRSQRGGGGIECARRGTGHAFSGDVVRHVFGIGIACGACAVAVCHGFDGGRQRQDVVVMLRQQRGVQRGSEVGVAAARGDIHRQRRGGHLADDQIGQVGRGERTRREHRAAGAQISGEYHFAVGRRGVGEQRRRGVGQRGLHGVVAVGISRGRADDDRARLPHGGAGGEGHAGLGNGGVDHRALERGVGGRGVDRGRAATPSAAGAEAQRDSGGEGQEGACGACVAVGGLHEGLQEVCGLQTRVCVAE